MGSADVDLLLAGSGGRELSLRVGQLLAGARRLPFQIRELSLRVRQVSLGVARLAPRLQQRGVSWVF